MGKKAEQGSATRQRLVEVATRLFAEKGYERAAVEEVLAEAGVSKGALYHHFPSKEALFEAVFRETQRRAMRTIARAAKAESEPLAMMRAGCQAFLDLSMKPAMRRLCLEDGPAVLGWQRWREIDEEYWFGLVRDVLQKAVDAGAIRPQNVDLLTHLALAMVGEAAMVIARADDRRRARAEAGQAVDRLIEAMAAGARQETIPARG